MIQCFGFCVYIAIVLRVASKKKIPLTPSYYLGMLDVVFRQIEIVLKDSTAFVYVTKSEKSSHFTLMT